MKCCNQCHVSDHTAPFSTQQTGASLEQAVKIEDHRSHYFNTWIKCYFFLLLILAYCFFLSKEEKCFPSIPLFSFYILQLIYIIVSCHPFLVFLLNIYCKILQHTVFKVYTFVPHFPCKVRFDLTVF